MHEGLISRWSRSGDRTSVGSIGQRWNEALNTESASGWPSKIPVRASTVPLGSMRWCEGPTRVREAQVRLSLDLTAK
jgi:hypothetical protein